VLEGNSGRSRGRLEAPAGYAQPRTAEIVSDDVVELVEKRLGEPLTSLQARALEGRRSQFTDGFEQARKPAPDKPSIEVSQDTRLYLRGSRIAWKAGEVR
jgi:hypothetical protein